MYSRGRLLACIVLVVNTGTLARAQTGVLQQRANRGVPVDAWGSRSQQPNQAATPAAEATSKEVRFWAGLGQYSMGDFDQKLRTEGNDPLGGRFNVGAEVSLLEVRVPVVGGSIKVPVGAEYLGANSTTTHTTPTSRTTVNWNLPTVGIFIAPTLSFSFRSARQSSSSRPREWLYLHPGIGYYFVDRWARASLTVSDRPGRLETKSSAPGAFVAVGANLPVGGRSSLFVEGGYRYLRFTDVDVRPMDGFPEEVGGTVVQAGSLTESLDYSGGFLRLGYSLRF